jgi:hypothetical protein
MDNKKRFGNPKSFVQNLGQGNAAPDIVEINMGKDWEEKITDLVNDNNDKPNTSSVKQDNTVKKEKVPNSQCVNLDDVENSARLVAKKMKDRVSTNFDYTDENRYLLGWLDAFFTECGVDVEKKSCMDTALISLKQQLTEHCQEVYTIVRTVKSRKRSSSIDVINAVKDYIESLNVNSK